MFLGINYILQVICLAVSLIGYLALLVNSFHVPRAFSAAVAFATITMLMFMGGMFDILHMMCSAILLAGYLAIVYELVAHGRRAFLEALRCHSNLFLLVGGIGVVALFSNATYEHYDNFSHWGSILADVVETSAFPADGSRVSYIGLFLSYMPIATSFDYYFVSVVGYAEGHALVGQGLLYLAGLSPLFIAVEGDGRLPLRTGLAYLLGLGGGSLLPQLAWEGSLTSRFSLTPF